MGLRILVVDDQTMVRGALAALFSLEPDIEAYGQAGNGHEVLEVLGGIACFQDSAPAGAACTRPVDVALPDVEMPVTDGIATYEMIRMGFPGTRALMFTTFGRPGYIQHSLNAGTSGFTVKDALSEQLAKTVRRVSTSCRVIDPTLAVETLPLGVSPLTERGAEVPRYVAEGGTPADTVSGSDLSQEAVRSHVSSTMLKTNARTRAQAFRLAAKKGWL